MPASVNSPSDGQEDQERAADIGISISATHDIDISSDSEESEFADGKGVGEPGDAINGAAGLAGVDRRRGVAASLRFLDRGGRLSPAV